MKNAFLPNFFSFKQANDLVRIGRDYDGGYLVSETDIKRSDSLIGMGINDDWSFEEGFLSYKKVEVCVFDASVNYKYFIKQLIQSLTRVDKIKIFCHWLKVLFKYQRFFSQSNVRHIHKFVGLNSKSKLHCTFLEALKETKSKNLFLKIDIEGSEFRILDDILAHEDRITGMVIEFHDCDIHLKKIEIFIEKFGLNLVHIHANNYAPVRLDDGLPLVLELTFSKHAKFSNSLELPHKLDMPNDKISEELELSILD